MAEKSDQHIIPQVHLRQFCDPSPPAGHPAGRPYTPALWIHDPHFGAAPKQRSPKNVGSRRNAYTLVSPLVDALFIENALMRLETYYGVVIQRIKRGEELSETDHAFLALFVGALHARSTERMNALQEFFDKLTGFSRAYMGDAADKSIEPWGEVADAGKRQIELWIQGFAKSTGPHLRLVENQTPMPFMTSDTPVTYRQLHADELLHGLAIPQGWMYREIPQSAREFFVHCALTPRVAYVASGFFPPRTTAQRVSVTSVASVFGLNELTRFNATAECYASSRDPYGPLKAAAVEHDRRRQEAAAAYATGIQIYTAANRYWIPAAWIEVEDLAQPPFGRIHFRTADIVTLRAAAADGTLTEVTAQSSGQALSGMRAARFVAVADSSDGISTIEAVL